MKELESVYFKKGDELRKWLQNNHCKSPGIWIIFYKKHCNKTCISYTDALEEALCFGWIDSIIKKLDDDRYARKFTPRKDTAKWSEVNKKKITRLIGEGRMTRYGLDKIDVSVKNDLVIKKTVQYEVTKTRDFDISDFILEEFARNEPALINFNNLAATYKRHYILWITNAKKGETVMARIKESIGLLKENRKLGLK